jgi:alpha-L-fucosidase
VAKVAYEKNKNKPLEICNTLQPRAWGYNKSVDGKHKSADEVMQMLKDAEELGANLLLNVGPMADGSIPEEDVRILREVGRRLKGRLVVSQDQIDG